LYLEEPINKHINDKAVQFNYSILTDSLGLKPGDRLYYYFAVWDNDGVNGTKMAKTSTMQFKIPTKEEQQKELETSNNSLKDHMSGLLENSKELKKEIELMREKVLKKKKLNWEDKQTINNLLQKQAELQQELENLQQELEDNIQQRNRTNKLPDDYLEKQQQLEKLTRPIA